MCLTPFAALVDLLHQNTHPESCTICDTGRRHLGELPVLPKAHRTAVASWHGDGKTIAPHHAPSGVLGATFPTRETDNKRVVT